MTPRRSDRPRYPSCARGRRHCRCGRHAWSGRHRRPLVLSPRRSPRRHPNVQFHETPRPQTYCARRPDHASPTRSGRPEHPERV
jgi:hypothetical protein